MSYQRGASTYRVASLGLLLWSCSLPVALSDQPRLQVTNGGFEDTAGSAENLQPVGWLTRIYAGTVRSGLDSQAPRTARYAASMESLSVGESASAAMYQEIGCGLEEGQDYTVTFQLKKTPLARAGVSVWTDGGAHFETQAHWDFQADFTQWREVQVCFQARRDSRSVGVYLSLVGVTGDKAWFDDVSLHAGRPDPPDVHSTRPASQASRAERARGYALFDVPLFEEVPPWHRPQETVAAQVITIAVSPGEFAAGSVGVYALRELRNFSVSCGDLKGTRAIIPAEDVDLRLVKWWRQRRGLWSSQPPPAVVMPDYLTPELLLKDDRWDDESHPRGFDADIRLTGPCITDVPEGSCRQVWIVVRVPEDARPGRYSGRLTFKEEGRTASTVGLNLDVLPFKLAETDKVLGAYVNTGYGFGRDLATYPASRYAAKLRDIRDHGLNSLAILDGVSRTEVDGEWDLHWDDLRAALENHQQYGLDRFSMFEGFIWATQETLPLYRGRGDAQAEATLQWYVRAINEAVLEAGLKPLTYYLIDEPHVRPDGIAETRRLGRLIQEAGGRTCTAVTLHDAKAIGEALDTPIVGLGLDTRRYLQAVTDGVTLAPEQPVLCYWQFWEEYPLLNRYLFGYLLWASGLDGAIPYGYQHFGGSGDPYDDFDGQEKDMFVAYPGRNGPVATVQWEACREGIGDLRYLRTLEAALEHARGRAAAGKGSADGRKLRADIRRAERFLLGLRQRIQLVPSEPVMAPPDAREYAVLRATIIDHILALLE